jgi:homoserine dehydrogenase
VKQIGIGLVGCGVVGGGVVRHLADNQVLLRERLGAELVVRKAAVRDPSKDRGLDPDILTTDWREVVTDPEVDIVVELMGGRKRLRRWHWPRWMPINR